MSVLEILVLKIFRLRYYFERLLCWLDHWLSCMLDCIHICVFLLLKNCFEKLARHLLDTLLSVELLKPFSYRNHDSSSIPGRSIEKALTSSIAPRHLVDRLSFYSWIWFLVARYFLDTSTVEDHFLDTYLDRFSTAALVNVYYARHLSRHLSIDYDPLACIIFHMFCIFFYYLYVHSILFFFFL